MLITLLSPWPSNSERIILWITLGSWSIIESELQADIKPPSRCEEIRLGMNLSLYIIDLFEGLVNFLGGEVVNGEERRWEGEEEEVKEFDDNNEEEIGDDFKGEDERK